MSNLWRYLKISLVTLGILLAFGLPGGCYYLLASGGGEETFTSPEGSCTILVRYDLVCRPAVYKKGMLWNRKIWEYSGSGFMETVHFGVEWLSENEIRLTYDDKNDEFDEEYSITIPD